MQYGMCKKHLKKTTRILKSPEHNNCHHEPLSQEWINGSYRTSKQYVTYRQAY